ncbi:uncharacterized protein SOCEGT47_069930 [Sorangium cellulosum]|uniref:Uncharacterized protein n=1 Tax=Sorangium cellulosum TaxID=56 RepID=A0A4P2QAU8_SORCE|nr:uncharacterized protein SOCEGT47_069930 [Sorangium cellulosum]
MILGDLPNQMIHSSLRERHEWTMRDERTPPQPARCCGRVVDGLGNKDCCPPNRLADYTGPPRRVKDAISIETK